MMLMMVMMMDDDYDDDCDGDGDGDDDVCIMFFQVHPPINPHGMSLNCSSQSTSLEYFCSAPKHPCAAAYIQLGQNSFDIQLFQSFFAFWASLSMVCPVLIYEGQRLCPLIIAWHGHCPFDNPLCPA